MRVLVVDDVPAMRHFLRLVLADLESTEVEEAGDGVEALKRLRDQRFDLVLLDLNMPLLDGLKVLGSLRQKDRKTPVLVVTTAFEEDAIRRAEAAGATRVIPKPVQADQILQAVREILRVPERRPEAAAADRREVRRLRLPIVVAFDGEPPFESVTWDVSWFGAFIQSETMRPVGTRARVRLRFPHLADPVEVACTVVHLRPTPFGGKPRGFGVRFDDLTPEDQKRLIAAFTSPA